MIDSISATVVLALAGVVLVACAALGGDRLAKGSLAEPVVAALGLVLLAWFDWWSIGGSDDLARDAEFGGLAQSIHRQTLVLIVLWSGLLAAFSLFRRWLPSRHLLWDRRSSIR